MKSIINIRKSRLYIVILIIVYAVGGCKKLVEVNPPVNSINGGNVYMYDETAAAVLTGIYSNMSSESLTAGGTLSLSLFPGLSADEFVLYSGVTNLAYQGYYSNSLSSTSVSNGARDFWAIIYPLIYHVNSALEGLENSKTLTPSVKQQLTGEAKFLRAFFYFYLVNLYGDVPLVLNTNYKISSLLSRTPVSQVYQQVIIDLKDAQNLLSAEYLSADVKTPSNERIRPTIWAATALLSRTYLYTNKYDSAESEATSIINNASKFDTVSLETIFQKDNKESIWQLQPTLSSINSQDAQLFILPTSGPNNSSNFVYLDSSLINSFESNDLRKVNWVDSTVANGIKYYYPYKYKINTPGVDVTEYEVVFRLAEQYLIRAEARAMTNKISSSISDLNVIRTRAGLLNYSGLLDQQSVVTSIVKERKVELFSEWGHRWFDLKRTGTINSIMTALTAQKGGVWDTNWQWYPIALTELQTNPNLKQNNGY